MKKLLLVLLLSVVISTAVELESNSIKRVISRPSPSPSKRLDVSDLEISDEYFEHQWKYYNKDGVTTINPTNYGYENRILVQTVNKTDHVLSTTKLSTGQQQFFVGIEDDMTCISRMDRKQMACFYLPNDEIDLRVGYDINSGVELVPYLIFFTLLLMM